MAHSMANVQQLLLKQTVFILNVTGEKSFKMKTIQCSAMSHQMAPISLVILRVIATRISLFVISCHANRRSEQSPR